MSSNNFAHVGRVVIPPDREVSKHLRGLASRAAIVVGVRADIGQVVVQVEGGGNSVPSMPAEQAAQLGDLITQAATAAGDLHAAYLTYRAALDEAEAKLAAAMGGGSNE